MQCSTVTDTTQDYVLNMAVYLKVTVQVGPIYSRELYDSGHGCACCLVKAEHSVVWLSCYLVLYV